MSDISQRLVISHVDEASGSGAKAQEITAFVSYWRPDRTAVMELADALLDVGVVAKGDWLLTAGAPFRDVLSDWIISSSTVVLILTPEFLASHECAKEVECARKLGKRLAPVVLRRTPVESIPDDLRAINWIAWPDDDAPAVAKLLRQGIDKDFEWEREHSRLAEREEQWIRSGKKHSFTLRRDDLRQAESWIARAGANSDLTPRPTPAIIDFVVQSRRDEKIVQRTVFGTIIAVLLILLATGAYALREANARSASDRRRAEAERARADADRGRLTEAELKLAAEKREREAHDLANLKQQEAKQQRVAATMNAENALRERLRQTEEMGRQLLVEGRATHAAPYLSAVYSQRAANPRLGETDTLRFMMARAAAPLYGRRLLLNDKAIGVKFVAFNADDSLIATVGDDGGMSVWDAKTGRSRCGLEAAESSAMVGVAFTPDRDRVLAYESLYHESDDPEVKPRYSLRVHLMDCTRVQEIEHYDSSDSASGDADDIRFEPPYFTADRKAFYFDFNVESSGEVFALSDGMALENGNGGNLAAPKIPSAPAAEAPRLPCAELTSGNVWASDNRSLAVDQNGMLYRTSDCAWLTLLEGPAAIRMAAFSHDNRLVVAAYSDGAVLWEWQRSRPSLLAQWRTDGLSAVFADAAGKKMIIARTAGIDVRDAATGRVLRSIALPSESSVTLVPLTERIVVESKDGVDLRDASTGALLAKLELPQDAKRGNGSGGTSPDLWQADPATNLLMIKYQQQWDVVSQTTFELRDLQTGEQLSSMKTLGDDFDALAMNWKRKELFTTSRNGSNASMWIDRVGGQWNPYYIHETRAFGRAAAAAFLPDGQTILTADRDGMARFHNTKTPREPIRTRLSDAVEIAVSRDGHFALIGNAQSTEILDLQSYVSVALCVGRMSGDRWAMSADSRIAVTSGPDAMVHVWDLRSGRLLSAMRVSEVTAPARLNEAGTEILVQAGKMTQLWSAGVERRSPETVSRAVVQLLPLRLNGERLVPRK